MSTFLQNDSRFSPIYNTKIMYFNTDGMPSLENGIGGEGSKSHVAPKPLCKDRSPGIFFIIIVKLTGLCILIACLQVSARSDAQQRIAINVKNVPLQKLFAEIERKTNYTFFYDVTILKETKPVTLMVKEATVEEILRQALAGQALEYT